MTAHGASIGRRLPTRFTFRDGGWAGSGPTLYGERQAFRAVVNTTITDASGTRVGQADNYRAPGRSYWWASTQDPHFPISVHDLREMAELAACQAVVRGEGG